MSSSAAWWTRDEAVWNCDLPSREKYVLLAILTTDRAARDVEMWPSMELVAWQTQLAYSTVRESFEKLKAAGILERTGEIPARLAGGQPRGRVAKYKFHIEKLPARPSWQQGVDSRRYAAPVTPRQVPIEGSTGADSHPDRCRLRGRQVPPGGSDLSVISRGSQGIVGRRAAAAARPRGGSAAHARLPLSTTSDPRGSAAGPRNAAGAPPRRNVKVG